MIQYNRVCFVVMLFVLAHCEEHTRHGPRVPHSEDGEHSEEYDHQAVLGSEELDDEFEHLPPEVAKSRLKKIVEEHDLNSDGKITKEEMSKWIIDSFKNLDREEAMEKFAEEDDNKDGKITWEEYLDKVYSFSHGDVQEMRIKVQESGDKTDEGREASSSLKMVDDDDRFFKAADLDKDGSLDQNEYLAFYFPPNYEHMHGVEVERFMRDTDIDKDGKISRTEFPPGESPDAESQISAEENFDDFDKDKDGFLSQEEVTEWVVPKTDDLVDDEVSHLFNIADTDGNGELAMEEILAKTKEFAGSSATDYGNFLQHDEL